MGVRGLTTYINYNQDYFLREHLLHDTNLIIDGHSLCAQLYRTIHCFSAFGGDYDKIASSTKTFFKHMKKCNISPYVLFDGSYETKKLKTAYSRLRSKIYGASKLDPVTQGNLQIFPLLLRDVFKQTLAEIGVPYTICEFEADDEIAAMARHLSCPVLSYDSDFFIYNVLYVPFNTLEIKPKPFDYDGKRIYAMECKIYETEYLLEHFGGLKEELLPLLATLLGNDYVKKSVFNKFFSQLKLPKSKTKKNEQQRCIHGLFKWLQNETLDSAISKIIGRLKKPQKEKVLCVIKKSVNTYNCDYCRSLNFFNISKSKKVENNINHPQALDENIVTNNLEIYEYLSKDEDSSSDEDGDNDSSSSDVEESESDEKNSLDVPEWFADGIRNNTIPHTYINLYTHYLHFCLPQAEDYKEDDSFLCTLPILRFAFDILTDFEHENFMYISRHNSTSYKKILINKEYSVQRPLEVQFKDLTVDHKKMYFKHFIELKLPNLELNLIEMLPLNFQIYMTSILWWVKYCNIPLSHVHSLLLCYVMMEVIDERTGMYRGHFNFSKKYSKRIEELKTRMNTTDNNVNIETLFLNKNKVLYEDCLLTANELLKYFEIDDTIRKKPKSYDHKRVHSFAQFQCCLQQINSLNILCGSPYETTKYSNYNGTFVYNCALKFDNQADPYNLLAQKLKGANTVLMFYKSIFLIYESCAQKMCLSTVVWSGKKTRRRKKNLQNDDVISFIVKGFESEVII